MTSLDAALAAVVAEAVAPLVAELQAIRVEVQALRPPQYGTIADAAKIWNCSTQTIRARIDDGRIVAARVGRAWRVDMASLRPRDPAEIARLAQEARR